MKNPKTNGNVANNGGKWIRKEKRRAIYERDGFRCVYCERGVEDGIILTLDHVTPQELGGDNDESNLVTACKTCNSAKGTKSTAEFKRYLGREADGLRKRVRNATRRKLRGYYKNRG